MILPHHYFFVWNINLGNNLYNLESVCLFLQMIDMSMFSDHIKGLPITEVSYKECECFSLM